jgi:hypothetical protein
MIPLIGSICKGPLGISQLPRTWWKVLTRQLGQLDETYPDNSGGLDAWCLDALEVNLDETYAFIRETIPDYVTFESWIVDRKSGRFDSARISRFNKVVLNRTHSRPHKITETYGDIGYDTSVVTETSALLLNTLQDWQLFHKRDLASGDMPAPTSPLISSLETGPLGIPQLPRTWLKIRLDGAGYLDGDYPACGEGLDQGVLDALGLDREETVAYVRDTKPDYLQFEDWVAGRVGKINRARVEVFRAAMVEREHPEPKLSSIHERTGCDRGIRNGVVLNHLEDWRYAYDLVRSR